jgi:AMMECR1 domain-containing protein
MQFEALAHCARHESGKPESASCFDALAASVDEVTPELLEAYVEMFQKIEHGKINIALRQSIQQGLWLPTSATEYMQRFIAFASGTGAPS